MEEAKVIFTLNAENISIQCSKESKMKDICQKFVSKVNKNLNFFIYLYEGIQVNLELTFKEQATPFDLNNSQMKILVYENKNDNIIYSKSGEIIKLNKDILDDKILSNNESKDNINGINIQIENVIKTSSMSPMNNKILLKNIKSIIILKKVLFNLDEKIKFDFKRYFY